MHFDPEISRIFKTPGPPKNPQNGEFTEETLNFTPFLGGPKIINFSSLKKMMKFWSKFWSKNDDFFEFWKKWYFFGFLRNKHWDFTPFFEFGPRKIPNFPEWHFGGPTRVKITKIGVCFPSVHECVFRVFFELSLFAKNEAFYGTNYEILGSFWKSQGRGVGTPKFANFGNFQKFRKIFKNFQKFQVHPRSVP